MDFHNHHASLVRAKSSRPVVAVEKIPACATAISVEPDAESHSIGVDLREDLNIDCCATVYISVIIERC